MAVPVQGLTGCASAMGGVLDLEGCFRRWFPGYPSRIETVSIDHLLVVLMSV